MTNEEINALTQDEDERIKILDSQIGGIESRLERLYDALETGNFTSDELAPRIRTLIVRKTELCSARDKAQCILQTRRLEVENV